MSILAPAGKVPPPPTPKIPCFHEDGRNLRETAESKEVAGQNILKEGLTRDCSGAEEGIGWWMGKKSRRNAPHQK
jgi:hypothetical protein